MRTKVVHTLDPVFNSASRILILGTMPSPASRAAGFYYGHPQNRFFRVLSDLFGEPIPADTEERKSFLLRHHIALWDVLASCEIDGADDSSIREPVPNDFSRILEKTDIRAIFTTGKKAYALYSRYCMPAAGIEAQLLPSTSPANVRISYVELRESYKVILPFL
jgi:double-stranded uracil-DNA glycosylase